MPQEIYHLAPAIGNSKDEINRVVVQLNLILEALSTQLGILQARDSQRPVYHSPLDLNGQRLVNVGRSRDDADGVTRVELAERGLFSRRTGDPHHAAEVVIATKGIKTPIIAAPGYAISFDQFTQQITLLTTGDTTFAGNKNFGGTVTISGGLTFSATTPTAIAANTNNYSPGAGSAFRISATAPFNVTGLANGSDGRVVLFFNVGANTITLTHEDALSTDINRFHFSTGGSIACLADAAIALWYDATTLRWRDWSKR